MADGDISLRGPTGGDIQLTDPATAPSVYVNVAGTWKLAVGVYVNVAGTWKEASSLSVNVSGSWKEA